MRLIILLIFSGFLFGYSIGSESIEMKINKNYVVLKADQKNANTIVSAPVIVNNSKAKMATFNVTYNGFSSQAQTAFQHAVNIWSSILTSSVSVKVIANWDSLGTNVLGSASAGTFLRYTNNTLPKPDTWYPIKKIKNINEYIYTSYHSIIMLHFNL